MDNNIREYAGMYAIGRLIGFMLFFFIASWLLSKVKTWVRIAICSFFIFIQLLGLFFVYGTDQYTPKEASSTSISIGLWTLIYFAATKKSKSSTPKK